MSDIEDVRNTIEKLKESQGPGIPGRDTPLPPKKPTPPIEDVGEQPKPNLPKGPAGY